MTIEQEFFKTFETEKRCLHPKECRHKGICRGVVACEHYTYPPITDRKLLELICINNHYVYSYQLDSISLEKLKDEVLQHLIDEQVLFETRKEKSAEFLKAEVQQLFKENE